MGSVDPNAAATIANAKAAGIKYVDGYIFPCYSCGDGAGQISDTINNLEANGIATAANATEGTNSLAIGMLWLDIEGTQYWGSSTDDNVAFISDMVDEGEKLGVSLGFYTSNSQWSPIAGGVSDFSKYPLWYAHYDGDASFDDFSAFGGWTTPAIKQYEGSKTLCGAGVDYNFY